jgi:DNA-directed RNA polymerase specialized sigma24 family protein
MSEHPTQLESAHRRRVLELAYASMIAAAHKLRRRYRTSFEDIDLTVEDLGQYGALKAIECYDRLFAMDSERLISRSVDDVKRSVVSLAMRCIAFHIIDVYRMRDRRRHAVAPDLVISDMDMTNVHRVELWRRIEPLMQTITPRQRAIVASLWEGLEPDEVSQELKVSPNVVQKDLAAIRRVAA